MSSPIKTSTGDLRSRAKEYQRDRNHNAKWARGVAAAPGKECQHSGFLDGTVCTECASRPLRRDADRRCGRHYTELRHQWNNKENAQKTTTARKAFRAEVLAAGSGHSDSSAGEDDVREDSAAPAADANIFYSFDASSSPSDRSDLLGHAVTRAVQRYENKQTEKIANEYEFVPSGNDTTDNDAAEVEDGFEMVDHDALL